jgi:hypothetical protein
MSIYATQRNATRNQSTVDYLAQNIFTYGNRYSKGTLINNLGESLDAQDGILVVRSATVPNGFNPATDENLADVIGILKVEGIVTLADAGTLKANYANCGDIDASMLILPEGVTLDTMVDAKALKDVLTALGFQLNGVTEMTKFDN